MSDMDLRALYCNDPYNYQRLKTVEVKVGNVGIGGENPIRVQSMTTSDTMDTQKSVEESIRMIDAGCELVRLTAPSKREAENLKDIKEELCARGYDTPLVADIHFTPNAAEIAARIVEKVRVNPGNYADKKKFEHIEYTEETYQAELERIEAKFTPLINICKVEGTAMRIGTNHGSLSDRILSKYGDTPEGMVESAMEFIRICEKNEYYNLVISMKASNTLVMVQAYRLLVATMRQSGKVYPLHLGVTEAGDGEDGRVKSAVGIGSLLLDGIGDTIRVSLTEAAENEIPVAQKLIKTLSNQKHEKIDSKSTLPFDPFTFQRLNSQLLINIGGNTVPVVISNLSNKEIIKPANLFSAGYIYDIENDKWNILEQAVDYIYCGKQSLNFQLPGTLRAIVDLDCYENLEDKSSYVALLKKEDLSKIERETTAFLELENEQILTQLQNYPNLIFLLKNYTTQEVRKFVSSMQILQIKNPIVLKYESSEQDFEQFQLDAASINGSVLIDGLADGIWLNSNNHSLQKLTSLSFGILQATRLRISKTEYISCPSCGRTLFDLQETTAKIRKETSHLKGLKIGIMGCIVNGPGEMADADYGYVGTGPGKINLYKEKVVMRKNIDEKFAVKELIQLIKENNDWIEPRK